ncbi:MAG: hypothetical protein NC228_00005, partial [[Eubacterium] siraeum]|nr:hypothetical protein [[Eubacterium] siraeum]
PSVAQQRRAKYVQQHFADSVRNFASQNRVVGHVLRLRGVGLIKNFFGYDLTVLRLRYYGKIKNHLVHRLLKIQYGNKLLTFAAEGIISSVENTIFSFFIVRLIKNRPRL